MGGTVPIVTSGWSDYDHIAASVVSDPDGHAGQMKPSRRPHHDEIGVDVFGHFEECLGRAGGDRPRLDMGDAAVFARPFGASQHFLDSLRDLRFGMEGADDYQPAFVVDGQIGSSTDRLGS